MKSIPIQIKREVQFKQTPLNQLLKWYIRVKEALEFGILSALKLHQRVFFPKYIYSKRPWVLLTYVYPIMSHTVLIFSPANLPFKKRVWSLLIIKYIFSF